MLKNNDILKAFVRNIGRWIKMLKNNDILKVFVRNIGRSMKMIKKTSGSTLSYLTTRLKAIIISIIMHLNSPHTTENNIKRKSKSTLIKTNYFDSLRSFGLYFTGVIPYLYNKRLKSFLDVAHFLAEKVF